MAYDKTSIDIPHIRNDSSSTYTRHQSKAPTTTKPRRDSHNDVMKGVSPSNKPSPRHHHAISAVRPAPRNEGNMCKEVRHETELASMAAATKARSPKMNPYAGRPLFCAVVVPAS